MFSIPVCQLFCVYWDLTPCLAALTQTLQDMSVRGSELQVRGSLDVVDYNNIDLYYLTHPLATLTLCGKGIAYKDQYKEDQCPKIVSKSRQFFTRL